MDPVLVGDSVPAGGPTLSRAAYPLGQLAQQEHLVAIGARLFGERRGGQTVAVGQQLLGGLGRQGLSHRPARRRLFALGLDWAVEDAVGAAPFAVSAERAASSDVISEFRCSMRPSIDRMSCSREGMQLIVRVAVDR